MSLVKEKDVCVCRTETPLDKLTDNIYPIMYQGREHIHIHTAPGLYEALSKMGVPLYMAGDEVTVVCVSKDLITLFNKINDDGNKTFTVPAEQFQHDFAVVK